MIDSISIDGKLAFLKRKIDAERMEDIHAEGFENLMVEHVISGLWLGIFVIICFTIAGVLAVLSIAICLQNYLLVRGWIERQQPQCPRECIADYHCNRYLNDKEELNTITRRTSLIRVGTQSTPAR
jgi:hypothetical protein